jgi:hypothetical protein
MFGLAAPATKAQAARLLPLALSTPVEPPHACLSLHAPPQRILRRAFTVLALVMIAFAAPRASSLRDRYHGLSA